ncbi:MAG: hypothetical protein ACE1ZN_02170 [Dehalococcoidia bacterium]
MAGASGAGGELLAALPHPDLRLSYVWVPVLPPDNIDAARAAAEGLTEPRAAHYWDGERRLAQRLGESLGITAQQSLAGLAWDVYLAYERGASDLFRPSFWMHQLGVTHAPRLEAAVFRQRVEGLLRG